MPKPAPAARHRVLLVDDHALLREGVKAVLRAEPDIDVVGEAADGETACRLGTRLQPDIVVMDLGLPKLNGVKATARLRSRLPKVRVLVLTVHDDRGYLEEAIKAGASGFMLKRSVPEELIRAVRTVASGDSYLDPALTNEVFSRVARSRQPQEDPGRLTEREAEVVRLIAQGYSNKEIAAKLAISVKTVEAHKTNAQQRLHLRGRTDIVRYAAHRGWLDDL